MRILIVSQYFDPEITAASFRLAPLAAGLTARGHEVEVLCEAPSHPLGVVHPDFRGRLLTRRSLDGYRVSHVWVPSTPSKRSAARILSYASYAAMSVAVGSMMKRPDVVFASSPPLSVGAVGVILGRRHRAPIVFDVRDLWPEVAVALGELGPGRVLSAAERLESGLYRAAAAITTPTAPFRDHIVEKCGDPRKVHVLGNGTTEEWLSQGQLPPDRHAAGIPEDRFVWTYAGNLGLSQGLEAALEAARQLGDGFQLLLLGDGTAKHRLVEQAGSLVGREVAFRAGVPPNVAQTIMRASDALVVMLADVPALEKTVPVKLYDSCAVGRPVILVAKGESRRVAERSGAALTLDPGDPSALAATVRAISEDHALRDRVSAAGRRFAEANLRSEGVSLFDGILEEVVERE